MHELITEQSYFPREAIYEGLSLCGFMTPGLSKDIYFLNL